MHNKEMRKLMKEVVQEVLKENGLIVESSDSTNESMVIKVGQHIFEGKISKIKKLKK
jgi:tRNA(His) 5'-end guanylyltransferase